MAPAASGGIKTIEHRWDAECAGMEAPGAGEGIDSFKG
jgi:hypothetical protein